MTVLDVKDLEVYYNSEDGTVQAVDGVSFSIEQGENFGIVGESGCGKSTLANAIIGTLPNNGYINGGEIHFKNKDLQQISERERRDIRWEEISLIPQSAMNALDPVYTIREQIIEAIQTHRSSIPIQEANAIVEDMFDLVGLDYERAEEYPHQFSGGMKQRAMIAMALSLDPTLVLADEPTTALDVIMQDQILKSIAQIQDQVKSSMVIITHDVAVIAETCDRVAVMYAGEIVEQGPVEKIFEQPYHPYTIGLNNAFPNIRKSDQNLVSIPGSPPNLVDPSGGCRFADRCPLSSNKCVNETPPKEDVGAIQAHCHHLDKIDSKLRPVAADPETWKTEGYNQ